jgi:RNA-directed DNA polymerase
MAIEPLVEYHFHDNSYGFRPKRSCHDATGHLFSKLARRTSPQWIIEGDIKGCFDNISHEHITKTMLEWHIPKSIVETVRKMLKAHIFFNGELLEVETGTPQGGVLSPMLANIALTALDNDCEKYRNWKERANPIVRYADDFVILSRTKEEAEQRKGEITKFLKDTNGLTLSPEKTLITHISEGCNFLGFNIRKYWDKSPKSKYYEVGKLLMKPQKEKVLGFLQRIQEVLHKNKTARVDTILHLLNPMLQGFALYYRFGVSKAVYRLIDCRVWEMLWRWAKRRHPNKARRWIRRKYFVKSKGNTWTLTDGKG